MAGGKLSRLVRAVEEATGLDLPELAVKAGKTARSEVKRTPALPKAKPLAVARKAAPKALPAPAKPLALPKPGPGLPEYAAKPRGGQWWTDKSPYGLLNPATSSKENIYLGARFSSDPTDKALAEWWDKALPRYIQNDFATPDDPLRALADRGYLQGIENAAQWSNRVKNDIVPMPLQKLLFDPKTAETGVREEALASMPWINKMPATENVYGFWPREETIGALSHIRDEMVNALKPESSGIPLDLAVRPDSLGRMSFAQAAERVGQINQWRAKMADEAQTSAMNSPAIHTFKEYGENNPMGLRWVELRAPDIGDELPEGYRIEEDPGMYLNSPGYAVFEGNKQIASETDRQRALDFIRRDYHGPALQQALRYEGDTMGHCVGGYCDDVLSGRSRIFSLRDAKGEPHVTIETAPGRSEGVYSLVEEMQRRLGREHPDFGEATARPTKYAQSNFPELYDAYVNAPDNIIQIKGKQNRAPKDDYLPFVQDFVKSQKWGNIGDFKNTGLVKLPDGRYLSQQQLAEVATPERLASVYPTASEPLSADPTRWDQEDWARLSPYFEGFAIGGRVERDRCFCRHPMAVR